MEEDWIPESLHFDDLTKLLACIEPFFSKPALRIKCPRKVALTTLDAFINALPETIEDTPDMRYVWMVGVHDFRWENGLFIDTPVYGANIGNTTFESRKEPLKTLTLNVNITATELATQVAGSPYAERRAFLQRMFRQLEEAWTRASIDIIFCQKQMDPSLIRRLVNRGMVVCPALSIRHIEAVRRATQSSMVSWIDSDQDWEALSGRLSSFQLRTLYGRSYGWLPSAVVTLLVGAPDEETMDEMKLAVQRCIKSLNGEALQGATFFDASSNATLCAILSTCPRLLPAVGMLRKLICVQGGVEFGRAKRHAVLGALDLAGVLLRINRVL